MLVHISPMVNKSDPSVMLDFRGGFSIFFGVLQLHDFARILRVMTCLRRQTSSPNFPLEKVRLSGDRYHLGA